ncbi:hypothetical protein FA13DRAFT_1805643 [Coprinellus micaceus]|uniref:F-box domain-containing protein n=1 Tax=Coprinellus micaceus TaxID=71717 RepID=A0A4Y7S099_COPMI|nr:hypothetical protein FA13DRAFT_1805643 [Coprinellus micaceus]
MTSSPNRPRTSLLKGAATARRRRAQGSPKAKSTSKRAGKPGQSKAKTAGVSSAKAGGKRRRTLSLLPTMPLDVLCEVYAHFILPSDEHSLRDSNCLGQILGLLSPKDLLNIFRTNSLFKTTLEGSDAKNIWTQARRRFDAPAPPPRFNEPQGEAFNCGTSNIHDADWKIQKRICSSCKSAHPDWFKGQMVPPKVFRGMIRRYSATSPAQTVPRPFSKETRDIYHHTRELYWDDDVHAVTREWKALKAALHTQRGQEELETWKNERLAHVALCEEMAPTYSNWERQYHYRKEDEALATMDSQKRWYGIPFDPNSSLLFSELKTVREEVARKSLSSDRYCCPPASILHTLSAVWQTLDAPESVAVTAQDFNVVVEGFPAYIATYQADLKRKVVPPSMQGLALAGGGDYYIPETARDQTLLGWTANRKSFMRCSWQDRFPTRRNVALAGLNPATATLSDMDTLDARFVIAEGSMPSWWTTDYMVFTWRGALHYFADEYYRHDIDPPPFRLATDEEVEGSNQHTSSLRATAKAWSCNRCQEFFAKESAETELTILNHIKERHGIENPQADDDYVHQPPSLAPPRGAMPDTSAIHHTSPISSAGIAIAPQKGSI